MQSYRVIWEIDIEADSPKQAAREALEAVCRHGSIATVFDVTDEKGVTTRVDLGK